MTLFVVVVIDINVHSFRENTITENNLKNIYASKTHKNVILYYLAFIIFLKYIQISLNC